MSRPEEREPAMMVRLRNTVRVELKKDAKDVVKQRFGRDFFVKEVLKGLFNISPAEVFCLQDFMATGFMDLAFFALKDCVSFFEAWKKKEGHLLMDGLQVLPIFAQDFIPLTVHIYNPFVEDGDVLAFIARYCETVRGGERLRDRHGIWNGKRRYLVKLRLDPSTAGSVVHPPGSFSIGSNRGFLYYPGQPVYCRRCGEKGHMKMECKGEKCRFCGRADHEAAACTAPKLCNLCGSEEHLYRGCPARKKSYASLFKEGEDLQVDLASLLSRPSSFSATRMDSEKETKKRETEGGLGSLQEKNSVAVEVDQSLFSGPPKGNELAQVVEQSWPEIDITEVFSGAAAGTSKGASQDESRSSDPTRFTWSQLDVLDIITTEQNEVNDSTMGTIGGRGRRRAVEENGGREEGRERKCSKLEKVFGSLEDLGLPQDFEKGAGGGKDCNEMYYENDDGGRGEMEWGENEEGREEPQEQPEVVKGSDWGEGEEMVAGGASDGFTWRNSRGEASRLDYVFVSAGVEVEQFFMLPVWLSDHCMVGVEVEVGGLERGRGSWRLNRSFLQDENFCQVFRHLYRAWQSLKGLFASRALWWEGVKERMAIFCRWWGRAKAAKRREVIKGWDREMQVLWNNEGSGAAGVGGRFYEIQGKVKDFYMKEAEKFMVEMGRRRRWLEEGPSKFLFAGVKKQQQKKCMETLRAENGYAKSTDEMLSVVEGFYKQLFSSRGSLGSLAEDFLKCLGKSLESEEADGLEVEVSWQEAGKAMVTLKKGTAPGCDGLPIELYCSFWQQIGRDLVEVYNESLSSGMLPESMRTGHVSLLYKKGDKEDLANWRPITLLNTDYKILAKVIAVRMRSVVGKVVHPDQTCGVPGRTSSLNLTLIRDAVGWAEQRNLPLAILSLDQEKAFDRVSLSFLFKVLERVGFGEGIRAWVRLLYEGAESRVRVNGFLTRSVKQLGGVRQGCPLSPLLYILFIEPLAARLRTWQRFSGLHMPGAGGRCAKVSVYADDMTLFLTSERDFVESNKIFRDFGEATGAKVNMSKSSVMFVGKWAGKGTGTGGYSLCENGLKILGVRFFRQNGAKENWRALVEKIRSKVGFWRTRELSLSGRALVIKADLLPTVNFLAYVFPIPYNEGRELESLVFSFLWKGGCEMVSRAQVGHDVKQGGRGVPFFSLWVAAIFAAFTARLIVRERVHKAYVFARFWAAFLLRPMITWDKLVPWSMERTAEYQWLAKFLHKHSWGLEQGIVLNHKELYRGLRERERVEEGLVRLLPVKVNWKMLQPSYIDGAGRDLHWMGALGRLPVRERLYRHGQGSLLERGESMVGGMEGPYIDQKPGNLWGRFGEAEG
ncbi:hypothetical protein F2P79_023214 [Pimephales promelas]|nr:hypothetical protein F2P79_023214 [Pimephales promelas]